MSIPFSKLSSPWFFFALTFGWTWLFWIPAVLLGRNVMEFPVVLLILLGGLGPALAGILLTYLTKDREGQRDYWLRVIDFKRISIRWYALILPVFPILNAIAILLDVLTGGSMPQFGTAMRFLSQPLTILPFVIFIFIFGPLPEELGWRGYALDHLQAKWSALASSLVLGTAWALWHLPLFFMKGFYHHEELGFGTLGFWLFCISVIAIAVLITWIYNNNGRSTLSAVLVHFMCNLTGNLFPLADRAEVYKTLLLIVTVIAITVIWGPKALTRQQSRKKRKIYPAE
ncbi:CPBP family intramembrane metalloprotease [Methanophagales archaeon]|nr:MAG: CPBP family intramembrane metalloprotease [Methanophagales archaeon]